MPLEWRGSFTKRDGVSRHREGVGGSIAFLGEDMMAARGPYDAMFYNGQMSGSLQCAKVVVPWLVKVFRPQRVIDVGCGIGNLGVSLY